MGEACRRSCVINVTTVVNELRKCELLRLVFGCGLGQTYGISLRTNLNSFDLALTKDKSFVSKVLLGLYFDSATQSLIGIAMKQNIYSLQQYNTE